MTHRIPRPSRLVPALLALLCVTATRAADAPPAASPAAALPGREAVQQSLAGAEKLGWRLGCQAWTFHHLTLFAALDNISALGLKYVELFPGQVLNKDKPGIKFDHNSPQDLRDQVKQKLKEAGVTAVSYGVVGLPNNEAGARKVFDFAKDMGITTIVSEPPMEAAPLLDKLAGEYGIRVALHDHPKPSFYWNPDTVLKFCEGRTNSVGSCSDTGHWKRSGLEPIDCLKKLDGHVIELHFKDLQGGHDVPWGTGTCDVKGMLGELKRQGFKGVFSIEYEHTTPELMANLAKCVEYFGKVSGELAEAK